MTTLREAAQQALEYMKSVGKMDMHPEEWAIVERLEAALAEPVQEPVAWSFEARHIDTAFGPAVSIRHPGREHKYMRNVRPLYTAPPQRKPLSEDEIFSLFRTAGSPVQFARAIERAHGIV